MSISVQCVSVLTRDIKRSMIMSRLRFNQEPRKLGREAAALTDRVFVFPLPVCHRQASAAHSASTPFTQSSEMVFARINVKFDMGSGSRRSMGIQPLKCENFEIWP